MILLIRFLKDMIINTWDEDLDVENNEPDDSTLKDKEGSDDIPPMSPLKGYEEKIAEEKD